MKTKNKKSKVIISIIVALSLIISAFAGFYVNRLVEADSGKLASNSTLRKLDNLIDSYGEDFVLRHLEKISPYDPEDSVAEDVDFDDVSNELVEYHSSLESHEDGARNKASYRMRILNYSNLDKMTVVPIRESFDYSGYLEDVLVLDYDEVESIISDNGGTFYLETKFAGYRTLVDAVNNLEEDDNDLWTSSFEYQALVEVDDVGTSIFHPAKLEYETDDYFVLSGVSMVIDSEDIDSSNISEISDKMYIKDLEAEMVFIKDDFMRPDILLNHDFPLLGYNRVNNIVFNSSLDYILEDYNVEDIMVSQSINFGVADYTGINFIFSYEGEEYSSLSDIVR